LRESSTVTGDRRTRTHTHTHTQAHTHTHAHTRTHKHTHKHTHTHTHTHPTFTSNALPGDDSPSRRCLRRATAVRGAEGGESTRHCLPPSPQCRPLSSG